MLLFLTWISFVVLGQSSCLLFPFRIAISLVRCLCSACLSVGSGSLPQLRRHSESDCVCAGIKKEKRHCSSRSFSYPGLVKDRIIIMDPNATTTAPTAAAATPGYPVIPPQQQQQQHYGQQFPFHPSAMSSPFPQAKPPSQQPSFGAVPFSQAGGPGGAATMMPAAAGFPPQHSSGMLVIF